MYRWKPNASQRREFAEKMKDPDEKKAYEERKYAKNHYIPDDPRSFANKSFIPTKEQNNYVRSIYNNDITSEQKEAYDQVIYGYGCQEKIHHDYIHIINSMRRGELVCMIDNQTEKTKNVKAIQEKSQKRIDNNIVDFDYLRNNIPTEG
jgi:hypothetical protein